MPLEFTKSIKGGTLLVANGFTFRKERTIKAKTIWKCTEYDMQKCRARCHTEGENIVQISDHTHVPDVAKIESRKTMQRIKERAVATQEPCHQIVAAFSGDVSSSVAGQLPTVRNIKQAIRRARRRVAAPLPSPLNLHDLELPDHFKKTAVGDDFLLYDSGPGQNRTLIFSTRRNLDLMSQCPHWYCDGTFKTTPPLFSQIYTIHGVKFNNVIPTVFVLMSERSTNSYVRVLTEINNLRANLRPLSIMTDFEHAALLAFRRVYPDAEQRGCFFHMSQCIWRRLQQIEGLQDKYTIDPEFALSIRQLAALAFVPVVDIVKAFDDLLDSTFFQENEELVRDLVNYFEDTWIGRPTRRGRRSEPAFSHSLWNCYDAVLHDLPKTNNAIEGWHRSFSELLGAHHPSIWKFIEGLQKEQSMNELTIEQYISGHQPPPVRRVYRDTAARIKAIVAEYVDRPLLDYLRGIAHNLNLQV
jgi:hypothetical protein